MAYRRSIIARAKLLYQHQQRIAPPFSHINRDDDNSKTNVENNPNYSPISQNPNFYRTLNHITSFHGASNSFRHRRFAIHPPGFGSVFARNFSSASVGEGAAEKIEIMSDMADVLSSKAVEVAAQAAPVANEVAIAAVDSFYPVAALQYLVDYVHIFTGFNWWASIALTTLMIRSLQVPLMINQLKSTTKFTLLRPKLEEIKEEMQNRDMSPAAVAEGQARMKGLFKEYGVTPFTPMKGLLISGPIFCSFFFAIRNMAENVPSFKDGGAFWFTDLTIPDGMYIFPVLTALTFWITVECNAQEGLEGNPTAGTIKNVSRGFAALTIPFTASFPQAIFCYWITSNLFSLMYGLVIKKPEVKKFLGIPIIPVSPPSTNQKPSLSFFGIVNKYIENQQKQLLSSQTQQKQSSLSSSVQESPKPIKQQISSSLVLNQRVAGLEKEVKGRKKGKKRR